MRSVPESSPPSNFGPGGLPAPDVVPLAGVVVGAGSGAADRGRDLDLGAGRVIEVDLGFASLRRLLRDPLAVLGRAPALAFLGPAPPLAVLVVARRLGPDLARGASARAPDEGRRVVGVSVLDLASFWFLRHPGAVLARDGF